MYLIIYFIDFNNNYFIIHQYPKDLHKLEKLDLSYNQLNELKSEVFETLSKLNELLIQVSIKYIYTRCIVNI